MSQLEPGFEMHDGAAAADDGTQPGGRESRPLEGIPWLAVDAHGRVHSVVYAANAIDASARIPRGTALYIGGPSASHPGRPLWTENWPAPRVRSR